MCAACFQGAFQLRYVLAFLCVLFLFLASNVCTLLPGSLSATVCPGFFVCVLFLLSRFLALFLFLSEIHAAHFETQYV